MSGIGRAVFFNPIEVTSANDSLSVSGSAIGLDNGVFGSVMTLCNNLVSKMAAVLATPTITFLTSSGNEGKITIANPSTFTITWTDTTLRDILGFTGNLSGANSYTSSSPVRNIWISKYTPSDREWWHLRHRDTFDGTVARTGELVGLGSGNQIYYRKMRFDAEPSYNLFKSLTSTASQPYNTLEEFIEKARASAPTVGTNLPTHGFYYMYNLSDISALYTDMESYTGLTHNATKKWAWCHLNPDGVGEITPSIGVTRDWYAFDLDIHTAAEPTWTAPGIVS